MVSRARPRPRAWASRAVAPMLAAMLLGLVLRVHGTGQSLLAVTLLAIGALALWTYTSTQTAALRYLFPGVAAAAVFVVFPMLYTIGLGFTNTSSSNLLDRERARETLLMDADVDPSTRREFTLFADGARVRLWLPGEPALATPPVALSESGPVAQTASLVPQSTAPGGTELSLRDRVAGLSALRALVLVSPEGRRLSLVSLREFGERRPRYASGPDGSLVERTTGTTFRPDDATGFFTSASGERLEPGFRVAVGASHLRSLFGEARYREPFVRVFAWTVLFAAGSVAGAAALGLLLAVLLNWSALEGRAIYRVVLFLPYAVPGFLSILIFKGLFNQNLGEINLVLHGLFGIRPAWFTDPALARAMLLVVNVWLGFPYMMLLCSGLIQSIPADLYEASAVAGAGPWTHFSRITAPLIVRPLVPLLIAAFAFNFNNFVLVSLLTGGRPDQVDAALPAGTTDILVSYTWRIAFQDSGQQFGLAAAISTVIFVLVAAITLVQLRLTRAAERAR